MVGNAHPTVCRLIIDPPAPGAWNMAVDEVLLQEAVNAGVATLRFYQWSEPTLSLGYFQRYKDRRPHAASDACAVVRRQTGGGAILHDRELTYSLALPAGHSFVRRAEQLYTTVHRAFIAALERLLAPHGSAWALDVNEEDSPLRPAEEPFLCFQRRARGDVLLIAQQGRNSSATTSGPPVSTVKILGSAQRRRRGAILQHGSLLLESSPAAPELPGLGDLTGAHVSAAQLAADLAIRLSTALGAAMNESRLPDRLRMPIEGLIERKYGWPGWTMRR